MRKNQALGSETAAVVQKEEDHYAYEIFTVQWLNGYFKNLIGLKQSTQTQSQTSPQKGKDSKIDEDLNKGLIKLVTSKDDEFTLGISGSGQSKKKSKGPKVSKRDQKTENSNILTLDLTVIGKIKDVGLNPPVKKDEIPEFLKTLDKTEEHYKVQAANKKKGIEETPLKVETTKKQESKVAQEVKEVKKKKLLILPKNLLKKK